MKCTYIGVFLEYNHVSLANLKDSFFGIGLLSLIQNINNFNLETSSPACCLITALNHRYIAKNHDMCILCRAPPPGKRFWLLLFKHKGKKWGLLDCGAISLDSTIWGVAHHWQASQGWPDWAFIMIMGQKSRQKTIEMVLVSCSGVSIK